MPETTYVYSVVSETANGKVNTTDLFQEILASTIVVAPARIDTVGGVVENGVVTGGQMDVVMKDAITKADLDAVVAATQGNPTTDTPEVVQLDNPKTSDGRNIFLTSRFRGDVDPYFAGCKDDDTLFTLGWNVSPSLPESKFLEWSFDDWVYVSKGTIRFQNALLGDYATFMVHAPATVVSENLNGTGNCNKIPIGGGANILVPAVGDGAWDVSDNDKIPVPAGDGLGYWDWDDPDTGKGVVSAAPGGDYHLLDVPQDLVAWIRKIPILGDGHETLHPETKARKVLPHWKFKVEVFNVGLGALKFCWYLDCARKKTV